MRALRLVLAGMVVLALLGGTGVALGEQADSGHELGPVYITGTWLGEDIGTADPEVYYEGTVEHKQVRGYVETWEWSDPRLPALMTWDFSLQLHPGGPAGGDVVAFQGRLESSSDPDGHWTGVQSGVRTDDAVFGQYRLVGEGGYEGLYAILHCGSTVGGCEGYIFEGEPPPLPEPPAE